MKTINLLTITILLILSSCRQEEPNTTLEIPNNIGSHHFNYILDMPEEYALISTDINHTDTLISWISNDTIHFRFKY